MINTRESSNKNSLRTNSFVDTLECHVITNHMAKKSRKKRGIVSSELFVENVTSTIHWMVCCQTETSNPWMKVKKRELGRNLDTSIRKTKNRSEWWHMWFRFFCQILYTHMRLYFARYCTIFFNELLTKCQIYTFFSNIYYKKLSDSKNRYKTYYKSKSGYQR